MIGTAAAAALPVLTPRRARAQANSIKIGVLNDQSGPYRDTGGITSVICCRQAVEEFAAKGFNVEVIFADHQNKPDIGAAIAARWYDRDDVDMILDVPTSSVALAVAAVAKAKDKVHINVGAATADLTGKMCAPSIVHWSYDTYMLAKSTGGATVKAGGDSWYFITADYAFGQQLQRDTTSFVTAAGGKVMGASPYPFPGTTDFSSFLLQAQASKAKVLGLCNAGGDTVNSIKQAKEFGLMDSGMKIAAMLMFINDVHALGLPVAQGLAPSPSAWCRKRRTTGPT
jgi:branched-chain amino acid transport system substrate-binding protein